MDAIARQSPLWDGRVVTLQVSDAKERTIEVRALVSARSASAAWDLRCEVREKLIAFLRSEHPEALPRTRNTDTIVAARNMGTSYVARGLLSADDRSKSAPRV